MSPLPNAKNINVPQRAASGPLPDEFLRVRGKRAEISSDGTVTPTAGQHVTCEVINDDIAPTITVHKIVVNDNGGQAVKEDFRLTVNSDVVAQDLPFDGIVSNQLLPGAFNGCPCTPPCCG